MTEKFVYRCRNCGTRFCLEHPLDIVKTKRLLDKILKENVFWGILALEKHQCDKSNVGLADFAGIEKGKAKL